MSLAAGISDERELDNSKKTDRADSSSLSSLMLTRRGDQGTNAARGTAIFPIAP
jgi:hypothetical protein